MTTPAWVTERTWVVNDIPTAAWLNTYIRDDVTNARNTPHTDVMTPVTPGGDRTTASATYVNIPSETVQIASFVKVDADTKLIVRVSGQNLYTTAGAGGCTLGVRVNSVDYDCATQDLVASPRLSMNGFAVITGLAAGTYSVVMRVKIAADTFHADTSARLLMSCEETL